MVVLIELVALGDEVTEHVVAIPKNLFQVLGVNAPTLQLCVGQSKALASVERHPNSDARRSICLSRPLLSMLHLHESQRLNVWRDREGGGVRFGPVLGILAGSSCTRLLGPHTDIIKDCLRLARNRGALAYAFGVNDINWEKGCISGLVIGARGLCKVECPLPDVVYDRVASRRVEKLSAMVKAKDRLLRYSRMKYYNRIFFNKWDVHRILEGQANLKRYLPSTVELTAEQLLEYLSRYQMVFVKPTEGSLGIGILRIVRAGSAFGYRLTRANRPDIRGVTHSKEKITRIAELLMSKGQYIVQRGIRLARVNGGPFDIRVLLQKNGRNKWFVESMVARVAEPGNIISNVADGAEIVSPRQALALAFGTRDRTAHLTRNMRLVAKRTAIAIEKGMGMEFAEMGVDLALDMQGRLWILEANSRPGRQTNDKHTRRVSTSVVKLVKFLCNRGIR